MGAEDKIVRDLVQADGERMIERAADDIGDDEQLEPGQIAHQVDHGELDEHGEYELDGDAHVVAE